VPVEANQKKTPTRVCVACRERRPVDQLIRFVASSGEVVPDLSRMLTGRGAHLCASETCLARATKRQSFRRALRVPVRAETPELRMAIRRAFEEEAQRASSASRMRRNGHARAGWIELGLREFTLGTPGAMNRGPAKRGPISGPEDRAERRSGNR
jgi:hypothetical protein